MVGGGGGVWKEIRGYYLVCMAGYPGNLGFRATWPDHRQITPYQSLWMYLWTHGSVFTVHSPLPLYGWVISLYITMFKEQTVSDKHN